MGQFPCKWAGLSSILEVRVLTLAAGPVEQLWDELLPLEVKELPGDLAALDELLSDPSLLAPIA
jgi:hypothetical protein